MIFNIFISSFIAIPVGFAAIIIKAIFVGNYIVKLILKIFSIFPTQISIIIKIISIFINFIVGNHYFHTIVFIILSFNR